MQTLSFPRFAISRKAVLLALALFVLTMSTAFAQGIPEVNLPPEANNNGLPGMLRWVFGVVIALIGLGVGAFALITVGGSALRKFGDYTNGRTDMGDVVGTAALGTGILAFALVLIALALRVIPVNLI